MSVYAQQDIVDRFIEIYERYYADEIQHLAQHFPNEQQALTVDLTDIRRTEGTFIDKIRAEPERLRGLAEEALGEYPLTVDIDLSEATVRWAGMLDEYVVDVNQVRQNHVGRLVEIDGQVNKRSKNRFRLQEGAFECQRCGTVTRIDTEPVREPHECRGCERQGPFQLKKDDCEFVDTQQLRLQIPPEKAASYSNESIGVVVKGEDLVNEVEPGDRVRATGWVDMQELETDNAPEYEPYAHISNLSIEDTDYGAIDWETHLEEIKEIANNQPYQDIPASIAPGIYGHEEKKLGIAASLFGGVEKQLTDSRGNLHMLLIGDPGTGKTDMISYASDIAPKSVFTDGKGSTSAGLTVSAVRNDFGAGEWSIEGGAVVKAHNGVACIDELDDMDEEDRSALHTVMEKQTVPFAKAGMNGELPAKTTLLGAANPQHGRFDVYDPIPDQINLDPALVSRFDLIFTMFDRNDEEHDRKIIEHKTDIDHAGQLDARGEAVPETLRKKADPEIDKEVLRAYIAYAKQEISPAFNSTAKSYIEEEFSRIRSQNKNTEEDPEERPIPVTFRKQDAVTRLSESLARMELCDEITKKHVDKAFELVKSSLKDVAMDPETGELDADRLEAGTSRSMEDRLEFTKTLIDDLTEEEYGDQGAPDDEIIEVGQDEAYTRNQMEHAIRKLKERGEIYEPFSDGYYFTT